MAVEAEPTLVPPTCTNCGTEMAFVDGGTEMSVPLVGETTEYQRSSCPNCGQAAGSERSSSDDD